MGKISEERKETLLKRYGSTKAGKGFGGPGMRGQRGMGGGKPKNAMATIKKVLAYIGRDKIKIIFVLVCVLSNGASLAGAMCCVPL